MQIPDKIVQDWIKNKKRIQDRLNRIRKRLKKLEKQQKHFEMRLRTVQNYEKARQASSKEEQEVRS